MKYQNPYYTTKAEYLAQLYLQSQRSKLQRLLEMKKQLTTKI